MRHPWKRRLELDAAVMALNVKERINNEHA